MAYKNKLTDEQWQETTDDIWWLDLNQELEVVQLDIIDKWLDRNCRTWWYRRDRTKFYLVGDQATLVALDFWLKSGVFNNRSGALEE